MHVPRGPYPTSADRGSTPEPAPDARARRTCCQGPQPSAKNTRIPKRHSQMYLSPLPFLSCSFFKSYLSLSVGFNGFPLCLCSPSLSPASFRSHFLSSLSFIVRFTFSSYLSICSYFPSFFMLVSYPFLPYLTSPFGLPSFLFHCISLRPATFLSKMIFNNKKMQK